MGASRLFRVSSVATVLLLTACGGGGSGSTTTSTDTSSNTGSEATSQNVSGVVSDPEIQGASVILQDSSGVQIGQLVMTGDDGRFTITGAPTGDLSGYKVIATGGTDVGTGENLDGIALSLPLDLYAAGSYSSVTVSPVTSLVEAAMAAGNSLADAKTSIATQLSLAETDLSNNPSTAANVMQQSMKLMLMRSEAQAFSSIYAELNGDDGLGEGDLRGVTDENAKARLMSYFSSLETAATTDALKQAYQTAVINRTVRLSLKDQLNALMAPDNVTIDSNLQAFAQHLMANMPAGRNYLMPSDVVATLSSSGLMIAADVPSDDNDDNPQGNINNSTFDATRYAVKSVNLEASFEDTLKLAFYSVDNPLTGNEQLVVHDAANNTQKVVKTDIILGNRAFVFDGHMEGDKEVYDSRKYGILLDPSQSKETRTAADGRGGNFEYAFYLDNAFKRYNIANPSEETLIYGSSMFPQPLKDQGMNVVAGDYTLFNNINDADNSYVELKVFESLPDTLRGESESSLLHGPILVRLGNSAMVQGHMISIVKGADGKTAGVLSFYEAVHKSGTYPTSDAERTRLQLCQADLSNCNDVTASGGMGDGKFFLQGENDTYVYMAKHGTDILYAYNKSDNSLSEVSGVKYPANFNHKIHTIASAAHGSGEALRSGFSNLSGSTKSLSDGNNAYVRINYDGDATDPVGTYRFLGDIHVYKHTQILKLTGTTGVKIFDNGDGIDHADESDTENVVGHANLVVVANGRLFVEIGNYEAGNGGSCTPSSSGYNCSSVYYGYLNTESTDKTELDIILKPKALLRYFVSRRIAPYAVGSKLYISTYVDSSQPYVFTLDEYDINNPGEPLSTTSGRTYFTKSAQRASGLFEGTVLSWDGATGLLTNLSTGQSMGMVNGSGSVIPGEPAINSVSGLTSGAPVAGIGDLFALKADPGGHRFYLVAGEVNHMNGMEYVDQVPSSSWLYE